MSETVNLNFVIKNVFIPEGEAGLELGMFVIPFSRKHAFMITKNML